MSPAARPVLLLLLLALLVSACGGGEDPVAGATEDEPAATAEPEVTEAPEPTEEPEAAPTEEPEGLQPADPATAADATELEDAGSDADQAAAGELPQFASDFDRVCETGVGFGGATPYEQAAGTHPVIIFEEQYSGVLIDAATTLPAGWQVEEDDDFESASEFAAIELIACAVTTDRVPNGTSCELEGEEGAEPVTLELVDATFEVTVHAATTGEVLGTTTIEAASTECPFFVFIEEGQTEYLNSPTDDQYTTALQPFVSP